MLTGDIACSFHRSTIRGTWPCGPGWRTKNSPESSTQCWTALLCDTRLVFAVLCSTCSLLLWSISYTKIAERESQLCGTVRLKKKKKHFLTTTLHIFKQVPQIFLAHTWAKCLRVNTLAECSHAVLSLKTPLILPITECNVSLLSCVRSYPTLSPR